MSQDAMLQLADKVKQAFADETPLRIVGGDSKLQLGSAVNARPFPVNEHRGIIEYQPTELVITARAGTPLRELEAVLAESGQMLPFEPPHLGEEATLGGTIACGLSGPRRAFTGSARDFTLGVRMINGRGEVLQFGGQVMKNVAGYDVSRLMVGAQGTLGVLLDVSLKVLPCAEHEVTLSVEMDAQAAVDAMAYFTGAALPLSAACHLPAGSSTPAQLRLRLSGAESALMAATETIRQTLPQAQELATDTATEFWRDLRERCLPFFTENQNLWRLSVPPATPVDSHERLEGDCLLDWAGGQRWLTTTAPEEVVHTAAKTMDGHADHYQKDATVFAPLSPALAAVHRRIKNAFDPKGILNPGRLCGAF
jgi:glycolate oxidase FAD binding subunit